MNGESVWALRLERESRVTGEAHSKVFHVVESGIVAAAEAAQRYESGGWVCVSIGRLVAVDEPPTPPATASPEPVG